MADRGIKKVVIPKSTLPNVTPDNKYFVRYRIQFAIQISSISKEKSETLEIYESSVISLV